MMGIGQGGGMVGGWLDGGRESGLDAYIISGGR